MGAKWCYAEVSVPVVEGVHRVGRVTAQKLQVKQSYAATSVNFWWKQPSFAE
jgi:hypothetical protein